MENTATLSSRLHGPVPGRFPRMCLEVTFLGLSLIVYGDSSACQGQALVNVVGPYFHTNESVFLKTK